MQDCFPNAVPARSSCISDHYRPHNRVPLILCLLLSRREKTLFYCVASIKRCRPVGHNEAKLRFPPLHLNTLV